MPLSDNHISPANYINAQPATSRKGLAGLLILFVLLTTTSCADQPVIKEASQFVSIFNGTNLDGWKIDSIEADAGTTFFTIQDGELVLDTEGSEDYVWLTYDKELTDFALRLKFIAYKDAVGNCGVQFRDVYVNNVYGRHGFDLASNVPQSTGFIWDFQEYWLPYEMDGYKAENFEPYLPEGWTYKWSTDADPWNEFEMRVIGSQVQTTLNGKSIIDWDGGSKIQPKGYIAIEVHKGQVFKFRFKDIELADLSD